MDAGQAGVVPLPAVRPDSVLQVGVVGHRELVDADALGVALADVLRVIADAARGEAAPTGDAPPSSGVPVLRCVSALAEGVDRIVAERALGLGYALMAVLPFARPDYERDFATAASRAEFASLLGRAVSVLELDGSRKDPGQAYLDAGRVVLEQSDVLLAVWDEQPARGAGGTGAVVREADERGIPVIVVASEEPGRIWMLGRAGEWRKALAATIGRLFAPFEAPQDQAFATMRDAAWARWVCAAYQRLVLLGCPPEACGERLGPSDAAGPAFERADQLAVAYGNRYRAASILKVTAPILSIIGVFIGFYGKRLSLPGWAEAFGFVLQVLTLGGVLWLFHVNRRLAWHARFLDFRYIAEQLRFAGIFGRLGSLPPLPRPAAFQSGLAPDWTGAYLRAVLRAQGLAAGRLTSEVVRAIQDEGRAQVEQQIVFYEARAARFAIMARRLNYFADACYWAGLAVLSLRAAIYFGWPANSDPRVLSSEVALVIPALAPIFLGLRAQGEYERLSRRYRAMVRELRAASAELGAPGTTSRAIEAALRRTAGLILAEVADWRVLIQARGISRL